ncbi:LCP family protein [Demequina capsici]|uniref:LCP family protein n=1 Tax=Demequina capsici TaxID=3075620 RepID=A0AA96FBL2_9MICO|nr:LCP family protein [Demequina sp. PMTSA13]WNM26723.1 LCP family protein [Demequina sp. PMTSA13]
MTASSREAAAVRRHGARQPGHPVLRFGALVVVAAVGFLTVGYLELVSRIEGQFDTRDNSSLVNEITPTAAATTEPGDASAGSALNILLMGSDDRSGENGVIGGTDAGGMRNDTTILLHISADRTRVELVSIPRDLQVQVSDCTLFDGTKVKGWYGDFNIAFSNGGKQGDAAEAAACAINTVQDLTGIPIDHWAVVDFAGFESMVDAIGGIPMCITQDISSKKANLYIDAGPHLLNGQQALAYARLRTAESGGVSGSDLQRITRQQELLRQTMRTLMGKNLLTDTAEITQFVKAMAGSMTMDEQLGDLTYLEGLAWSLRGLSIDDVTFATVPWEYTSDFLNVVATDDAATMWQELRDDTPLTVDAKGDASSAWDTGHDNTTATPAATGASSSAAPSGSATDASSTAGESTDDLLAQCTVQ